MKKQILYPLLLIAILYLSGCPQPNSSADIKPKIDYYEKNEYINNTGIDQNLKLLLTNFSPLEARVPLVTVNGKVDQKYSGTNNNINRNLMSFNKSEPFKIDMVKNAKNYRDIYGSSRSLETINYDQYSENDSHNFWLTKDENGESTHYQEKFILKSKSIILWSNDLELYIWVDHRDSSYPQEAINRIRESFYRIYKDMVYLFGEHWGFHNKENTIPASKNDIHILLTDIDNDFNESQSGYISGYYYGSKDTKIEFINENGFNVSNQNSNIVLDSSYYFNKDNNEEWKSKSSRTAFLISTMIHEFQHMIHYYKKEVLQDTIGDKFFNEMFSMVAEDILSDKYLEYIYTDDDGDTVRTYDHPAKYRVPEFNLFWDSGSSFEWGEINNRRNYSISYLMGAYLIRNYGIAPFKHYLDNPLNGKDGIISSLNSVDSSYNYSTQSILQSFGTAILTSNIQNNTRHEKFNKNYDKTFEVYNRYDLVPLNIMEYNYMYYSRGDDENRLYKSNYEEGFNEAGLRLLSLKELAKMSESLYFLEESNIYVDLGIVKNGEKVEIYFFDPNLSYEIIY